MSELTEEQRAFLVGPDARMDGYYIGFDKTGNEFIDQILSAVAYAAKGAHGTEAWSYELEYGYGPVPADKSFEWLIQEAANDAAERLTAASADDELIEAYNDAVRESMAKVTERDGHASSGSRESIVAGLRAVAGLSRPAQVEPTGCPHEAYEADREGRPSRCADCGENLSPSALKTVLTTTPKQGALPEYFAPKPPMTTNRFTTSQEELS